MHTFTSCANKAESRREMWARVNLRLDRIKTD